MPSELNAAYLWGQLTHAEEIYNDRMKTWSLYYSALYPLYRKGMFEVPVIPDGCVHNAHMFYIKCKSLEERTEFINYMKSHDVMAVFHYVPLHSAPAGKKFGRFCGEDEFTTQESNKLVRLPLYYRMKEEDTQKVIDLVRSFYDKI